MILENPVLPPQAWLILIMIETILNKLTTQDRTQLIKYYSGLSHSELMEHKIAMQIEFAIELLQNHSRNNVARELMQVCNISKATAYRRINFALSQQQEVMRKNYAIMN